MDTDSGVGMACGSRGWAGRRRGRGGNWDNCNRITIKKEWCLSGAGRRGRTGNCCLMCIEFQFYKMEESEVGSGDGCTTV